MSDDSPKGLAKITWNDPNSGERKEYVLTEGSTITIGRSLSNEVCIREQHVSRQHAVIAYQFGLFMITDLGSANGTFVNDQKIEEPFPLASGDVIRLYVPLIQFSGVVTEEDEDKARETGTFIMPPDLSSRPKLMITSGPQEGTEIPLNKDEITIGRATIKAWWDIGLQDKTVSRPHMRIELQDGKWIATDLGSSNGSKFNNEPFTGSVELNDGAVLILGETNLLFRHETRK